jgi:hypothetical protein
MTGRAGFHATTVQATIADEGNLSAGVRLGNVAPVAIHIGAGWIAADLTFQASIDGGATWVNVHESGTDTELTVQAGASRFIGLLEAQAQPLAGVQWIKVRSGTSGAPVTQTAGPQVVTLICAD